MRISFKRLLSNSLTNKPLPPISARGLFRNLSPVVETFTTSISKNFFRLSLTISVCFKAKRDDLEAIFIFFHFVNDFYSICLLTIINSIF